MATETATPVAAPHARVTPRPWPRKPIAGLLAGCERTHWTAATVGADA